MAAAGLKSGETASYLDNDPELARDERWLLVERIVSSNRFERAGQLRAMLKYVSWHAIRRPGETVREEDIAHNAMERNAQFDPAYDSVVRVQASHLRRRLEQYFVEEGASEPIVLRIPKGSYTPQFQAAIAASIAVPHESTVSTPGTHEVATSILSESGKIRTRRPIWIALAASIAIAMLLIFGFVFHPRVKPQTGAISPIGEIGNKFLQKGSSVAIVLPDTSLMEIQTFLKIDVSLPQYVSSDFPENILTGVANPELRQALAYIGMRRATGIGESSAAMDLEAPLADLKIRAAIRYDRDLNIRDLREGNVILIGNSRSNPWSSLFADQAIFRYYENGEDHFFVNTRPKPGEQAKYVVSRTSGEVTNYVDIALVPNLTNTGYVLLINGSDMDSNEAALGYLLHGNLPAEASRDLARPGLKSWEILLSGRRLGAEADHRFEVVAYKSQ